MVDAYAAVRRAAGASDIVKDSLENNDLETIPANLGSLPPYSRSNLNIDKRDRDYFRFDSPNGSLMTITTDYPQGLGALAVHSLESPTRRLRTPCSRRRHRTHCERAGTFRLQSSGGTSSNSGCGARC